VKEGVHEANLHVLPQRTLVDSKATIGRRVKLSDSVGAICLSHIATRTWKNYNLKPAMRTKAMDDNLVSSLRMDKQALTVSTLSEEGDDREYWRRATPDERLLALEFMRQVCYGYDACAARLQRLLTVAQLGER
jgi:hypothetical protein